MSGLTKNLKEQIDQIIGNFPTRESALLPLFNLVYKENGKIDNDNLKEISDIVNLPYDTVEKWFNNYRIFMPNR